MTKSYDHICFDLDGVLLDSENYEPDGWIHRAFSKILEELEVEKSEENIKHLYSDSLKEDFDLILKKFGLNDPQKLWSTREKYLLEEKLEALSSGEIGPFKDVDILPEISENFSLSIVSNSPQPVVEKFLQEANTRESFRTVIGRGSKLEDFMKTKPNPHLLKKMRVSVQPDKPLYVGDRETDYEAADSLEMDFCWMIRDGKIYGKEPCVSDLSELEDFLYVN